MGITTYKGDHNEKNTKDPREYDLLKKLALDGKNTFKSEILEGDKLVQHLLGYCLLEKEDGEYYIRIKSIEKYLRDKHINDRTITDQTEKRQQINLRTTIFIPMHEGRLILLVKDNIHAVVDMFNASGLMVTHFRIEMEIAFLLKYRVKFPVMFAVYLLNGEDRILCIAFASVLFHDPQGRDPFPRTVLLINNPDHTNIFTFS